MLQDAYTFLLTLHQVQLGIMADDVLDVGFGNLTYTSKMDSPYFNNILVNRLLTQDEIHAAEKIWAERKRASTFYFENTPRLDGLKTHLATLGYQHAFEDCWMFHPGTGIDSARFSEVKEVKTTEDLEVFLEIFDKSFQNDDPQNPYGELGDGLEIARNAWLGLQGKNKLQYFVAYQQGNAVAVSALTNYQNHGYVSNVGSLRDVRGQGYGKLVTLFAVDQSVKRGNTLHYLGTEEGHYPHEFYRRIGFETKYKAVGVSKS